MQFEYNLWILNDETKYKCIRDIPWITTCFDMYLYYNYASLPYLPPFELYENLKVKERKRFSKKLENNKYFSSWVFSFKILFILI